MDESDLITLAHEFNAGSESFLLQLRIDLLWDKQAFDRLTEAMRLCCKHYQRLNEQLELELREQRQSIYERLDDESFIDAYQVQKKCVMFPDWLAEGFWYVSTFVRDYTAHPYWQRFITAEPEYYAKAYERLDSLASWFFSRQYPWRGSMKAKAGHPRL